MHEQREKWHGPVQYLQRKYNSKEPMHVFAGHLHLAFPPRDDVAYLQYGQLPVSGPSSEEPLWLTIRDLSYHPDSSTMPAPYEHVAKSLLVEYLANG
eukprot:2734892-Alexandrium_andersonii.AAC.1